MTREEIEAAERWNSYRNDDAQRSVILTVADAFTLAAAYLAERQQRERDNEPPTRELFERLDISDYRGQFPHMLAGMAVGLLANAARERHGPPKVKRARKNDSAGRVGRLPGSK